MPPGSGDYLLRNLQLGSAATTSIEKTNYLTRRHGSVLDQILTPTERISVVNGESVEGQCSDRWGQYCVRAALKRFILWIESLQTVLVLPHFERTICAAHDLLKSRTIQCN
jgi:hypothetical protein